MSEKKKEGVDLELFFGFFFLSEPNYHRNGCLISRRNICMAWHSSPKVAFLR